MLEYKVKKTTQQQVHPVEILNIYSVIKNLKLKLHFLVMI